ncbi:hypothetical protein RHGRI_019560 [Rhododendron griersonianum]|uniref:Uncharacterized protein n=1 Tax=Rhododendron griersonianum TaxID=479676 RepID=A0AAV6JCW9_9ERIC|nr:hypothetical protein RHGRI_019560 [Rhododendron griersonianum]
MPWWNGIRDDLLIPKRTDPFAPGEKGLLALAPPHQGIDGEWSDRSGVIVYKWNDKTNRPNTGSANWKKRWSCCAEHGIYHPIIELIKRRSSAGITWMALSPSPTLCHSTSPIK